LRLVRWRVALLLVNGVSMDRIPGRLALLIVVALSLISRPVLTSAQATPGSQASPVAGSNVALESAVTWLQSQQADDGGWVGFSGTSDVGLTIDAVLALVAASYRGVSVDMTAATGFLVANGTDYAEAGTGQAAKLILVAAALNLDPRSFEGEDLIEVMKDGYDSNTNFYGAGLYDHALVVIALVAAGEELPEDAIDPFDDRQLEDGSWAFDGTEIVGNGDTNTTAIAIQALAAAGATEGDLIMHALEYLAESALPQGYPFQRIAGATADANSTALVVQGLIAAGEDPAAQEWQNLTGSLLAFKNESGSFSYQLDPRDENLYATVQAIPAIAGLALPFTVTGEATAETMPTCTAEQLATPEAERDLPCAA
jgi:hypothetical protein